MQWQLDEREVYAYTGGRPPTAGQPTVVLIHGAQHDHSVWILQSRWLAHHGYNVLAVDLPGHGRSAGPALPDIGAMADWVLRLLSRAGVTQAMLVGHSMGSLIALEAAARAPDRIRGIALVGTAFPMAVSEALLTAARDDEERAFDLINRWSHARWIHRPGTPGPGFSVHVQNLRLMQRQPAGVLLNDFAACNAYQDGLERARALRCPALFVLGARDAMTPPKAARALIDAIPGARVVQIPDCGHALMTESPDGTRRALAQWLSDLDRPAT